MTSADFKRAVFAQRTDECFVALITFSHPNFEDDIRVCSDPTELLPVAGVRGIVSRGEEYIFLPFDITLPAQDESGISRANIRIDNIDRRIVLAARQANSAIDVKIEIVLASNPDVTEFLAENFKFDQIEYDAFTVSGDISVQYFDLEPYPFGRFTPSYFPGIF